MKAIIYEEYGGPEVLQLRQVAQPVPKPNELLVRVQATAVNSGDWRLRKADPFGVRLFFGLFRPRKKILGGVFSGIVEETGKKVTRFKPGDLVFGSTGMSFGAYAQYLCLSENAAITLKPSGLSHLEAAVVPFGNNAALHFMKKANMKAGQKVLIYGASGSIGTAAVQLAKYFGAHVTAVCSTSNLELVRSLGADKAVDYTTQDFTGLGDTYDVIMETVNKIPFSKANKCLKPNGTLIMSAAEIPQMLQGAWMNLTSKKRFKAGVIKESAEGLDFLTRLLINGHLKPVIDKVYKLDELAEAHTYVEAGHKKGNVAVDTSASFF